jgi:hypothetical protein
MSNPFTTKDPLVDIIKQVMLGEKKLTDAEMKKREEIAKAMERDNPGMDMGKKMAIATAQAKKVAEEVELDEAMKPFTDADHATAAKHGDKIEKNIEHIKKVPTKHLQYLHHHNMGYSGGGGHEDPHLPHIKAELKKRGAKPLPHTEGEKMFNESFEQIDEISDKTLGNYVSKAVVDVHNDAKFAGESGSKDASKKAFKRLLGVKSAAARLSKQNVSGGRISNYRAEEVNLQEITTKSGADVDRNLDDHDPEEHGDIPDRKPDHELETHGGTTLHVHHVKDSKGKTTHTIINHVHDPAGGGTFVVKGHAHPKHILSSYNRAEREDMYESVNLDEQLENFWEAYTTMFNEAEDQQQNMLLRAMAKDPSDLMKMKRAIKMGDKALTNPALRQEILAMLDKMMNLTTADPSLLQRTKMGFQKAKMKMPEEVELDEANKSSPTHYHSANLRHKQKQKLTSDHVVTSTGHVVHKSTGKVVGHVKKDSVVRRRHGGLASYDKDTHGQIPATHKPATPKPAATTDNKDDGPLGRTILSYPKPKRTLGEALVAIGDKPRPKPAATHIVDKPGHPLHGKPVSVLGGAGRVYGTRTAGMAVHHDGKNHIVSQQHLKPIPKSEGDSKPKSTLGEAIGAKDKQDEGEYGYEGDMAMSQLRTIIRNCQEMMKVLDKETDMPEWVQSKITLATDYLQTANDYLMSELEEAANPAQQAAIAIAMKKAGKKPKNEEVEKAPFEGGREVKSSKPAAMRVKKIAKGMQKLNTPKDKK